MCEYNNDISLNDISEITKDIANNIYRIRKSGKLDNISEIEFKEIYNLASKLDRQILWAIAFQNSNKSS